MAAYHTASCIANNWARDGRTAWEIIYEREDDDGVSVHTTYLSEKSASGANWVWFDEPIKLRHCTITIKTATHMRHIA